ncbi:ABC transporter ATP-binding protein [Candidatus Obscuribacterales bacterium]|jgi:ABC-2 type transport system ATP-binding protein|nr:ABC transporter ATP-binding protein [Candidatus Obscuribacterales bacterium]MBX3135773.1 ABC transporter ATP-binding protein [Candidatus Obscuribacterales bacterium]MBX3151116.1 ABC transporter ATP-binding protein [Candidatus Obscuribacterales bacterium]
MFNRIVEVTGLRKQFGPSEAVKNVTFHADRGEIVGLLGANGAGKTTTIHMLLGLTKPTAGTVRVFGQNIETHRTEILQRVNFASSYVHLPYNLKVSENLTVFAKIYGVRNPKPKIDRLLEDFEIAHLRNSTSGRLSSGEQTRLNLCKALLNDPEVLVLDEPTASLDPDLADKVRKVLQRYNNETGCTLITTSHNMLDVGELCNRIVFMRSGEVVEEGSSQDILRKYESDSLEDVFIAIARNKTLEKVGVS